MPFFLHIADHMSIFDHGCGIFSRDVYFGPRVHVYFFSSTRLTNAYQVRQQVYIHITYYRYVTLGRNSLGRNSMPIFSVTGVEYKQLCFFSELWLSFPVGLFLRFPLHFVCFIFVLFLSLFLFVFLLLSCFCFCFCLFRILSSNVFLLLTYVCCACRTQY